MKAKLKAPSDIITHDHYVPRALVGAFLDSVHCDPLLVTMNHEIVTLHGQLFVGPYYSITARVRIEEMSQLRWRPGAPASIAFSIDADDFRRRMPKRDDYAEAYLVFRWTLKRQCDKNKPTKLPTSSVSICWLDRTSESYDLGEVNTLLAEQGLSTLHSCSMNPQHGAGLIGLDGLSKAVAFLHYVTDDLHMFHSDPVIRIEEDSHEYSLRSNYYPPIKPHKECGRLQYFMNVSVWLNPFAP